MFPGEVWFLMIDKGRNPFCRCTHAHTLPTFLEQGTWKGEVGTETSLQEDTGFSWGHLFNRLSKLGHDWMIISVFSGNISLLWMWLQKSFGLHEGMPFFHLGVKYNQLEIFNMYILNCPDFLHKSSYGTNTLSFSPGKSGGVAHTHIHTLAGVTGVSLTSC